MIASDPTAPDSTARWRARARVVRAVREFFWARGFIEVDTPVALSAPAPEPHIEAPAVTLHAPEGQRRFLQPSPELPMKRLLAGGLERIFQIAVVFRDGEHTPLHRPEFRMLEWYRAGADWTALLDDCEGLLRAAADAAGQPSRFTFAGREVDLEGPFARITVDEAFREHAGFSILDALEPARLRAELDRRRLPYSEHDPFDDLFHRIFLSCVEPKLCATARPTFLTGYPAPLAALARLDPHDPRQAERFELYAGGLELANAFGELTDAAEQRRRFERDREVRRTLGMQDYPIDERFLCALEVLSPSAGIALGLDRLLLLVLGGETLDDASFIRWDES